jgi:hypothetical protein
MWLINAHSSGKRFGHFAFAFRRKYNLKPGDEINFIETDEAYSLVRARL